jgi:hypothetical protein
MQDGQRRADIPTDFDELDDRFFSIGQDDSYYEALNDLGPETRDHILRALRDMALDRELFTRALNEKMTGVSPLQSMTPATIQGRFRRKARSGARLSRLRVHQHLRQAQPSEGEARDISVRARHVTDRLSIGPPAFSVR